MQEKYADIRMANLAVKIVRYVDDRQPGWVETHFVDVEGKCHGVVDKIPGFTVERLGPESQYPRPGKIRCQILSESQDELGRRVARISTAHPYDIESTEGLSEFTVLSTQLSD